MFVTTGYQSGFWLWRTTWSKNCAWVTPVNRFAQLAPYYGNCKVHADIYDLTTSKLREAYARLPTAGTYKTGRPIDSPASAAGIERDTRA